MMLFNIYHPAGGVLNSSCKRGQHQFMHVATVEATSLEEAFKLSQNDFNPEYSELNIRSTSVGDIITDPRGKPHMVMNVGFQEVPVTVLHYIDWTNPQEVSMFAQQVLDNPEDYGLV